MRENIASVNGVARLPQASSQVVIQVETTLLDLQQGLSATPDGGRRGPRSASALTGCHRRIVVGEHPRSAAGSDAASVAQLASGPRSLHGPLGEEVAIEAVIDLGNAVPPRQSAASSSGCCCRAPGCGPASLASSRNRYLPPRISSDS